MIDLDQEPDDLDQEAEPLDQEEPIAGSVYACRCPAGGPGGNRPHRFLGYCRRCALESGGPGWVYACGAPNDKTGSRWGCRCSAPDLTQTRPGWRRPEPAGQTRLF